MSQRICFSIEQDSLGMIVPMNEVEVRIPRFVITMIRFIFSCNLKARK